MMNKGLRFGVVTVQVDVSWEEMVERWRSVEHLGFDSVWLADEFVYFTQPTKPWLEACARASATNHHRRKWAGDAQDSCRPGADMELTMETGMVFRWDVGSYAGAKQVDRGLLQRARP